MNKEIWERIEAIYDRAIQLEEKDRVLFVKDSADGDTTIYQQVIKMLKSDIGFMEEYPGLVSNTEKLIGDELTSIGRFKIIKKIATGGMGRVYLAQLKDSDVIIYVALKTIRVELTNKDLEQKFQNEKKILSKLQHKNIVRMVDAGISKNGIPFLALDYIEDAKDIKEYVEMNKSSTTEIVKLVKQVAQGLSFAHHNFIIHKDIKPNNILVDKHGIPQVVDFGIATFVEQQKRIKKENIYTPGYASPEQILAKDLSPNCDIFSLCAVLLELLTKQKPLPYFEPGKYIPQDDTKHVNNLLKQSKLDSDLQNIIKHGLAIDPQKRYQTMSSFMHDLGNWLNKKPISASQNTNTYLVKKFIQRNTTLTLALSALSVSILTGIVLILQQKSIAQIEAKNSQHVTKLLIDSIQASDPDLTKGRETSVIELLQNAKIKALESKVNNPQLNSLIKYSIGKALNKVGKYKDAEKILLSSITNNPENIESYIALAQVYLQQKQFDSAEKQLVSLNEHKTFLSQKQRVQMLQIQAEILNKKGLFEEAKSKIKAAISINPSQSPDSLIQSNLILGLILNEHGKHQESIKVIRDTLDYSKEHLGGNSTTSVDITIKLAKLLSNAKTIEREEIYDLYQQAIKTLHITHGKNHPMIAKTLLNYGFAQRTFGELDKALISANNARKIALINFDEKHMLTAHIDLLISQINLLKGNINESIKQLENVVKVYEAHYGVSHFETNQTKTTLGSYLVKAGKGKKALEMLLPLYSLQKNQLGENNKASLYVKLIIIKAQSLLERYQLAVKSGKESLEISQKHLGEESIISIGLQMELAKNLIHIKDYPASKVLSQQLLTYKLIKINTSYKKRVNELLQKAEGQSNND